MWHFGKAEQTHKMRTIFTQMTTFFTRTILSKNSCPYVNLLSFANGSNGHITVLFSQLKIKQSTEISESKNRPPLSSKKEKKNRKDQLAKLAV